MFLREAQKKKNTKIKAKKREMKRVEAFDVNDWLCGRCKDVLSGAHTYKPCTCDRPPQKETFLVTGQGGSPVYSNASVKFCTEYITNDNDFSEDKLSSAEFLHPVLYEDREPGFSAHEFEVNFRKGVIARNGR